MILQMTWIPIKIWKHPRKRTETSEYTSQETVKTLQKSYLFNGQFFSIVHCDGLKLVAQCKNCSKVIHGQKMSTGNFLSHLRKASSSKRTIQEVDDDTADDIKIWKYPRKRRKHPIAQCKNCSKVIHGQKMSTGNFLSHLRHKHQLLLHQVQEARNNAKRSNKTNVLSRPTKKFTKQQSRIL
ncbi:Uncharacterized protein FWK35_00034060, partial [Aphis craccivora]